MNHHTASYPADAASGLEARFGLRIAAALNQHSERTDHDISERLRFAREQALERARAARSVQAAAPAVQILGLSPQGTAVLGGQRPWWPRLASAMPLVALVLGLFLIDQWHDRAQIAAAADVDAALLADDLPPDAYSDPGFVQFLKTPQE